MIRVHKLARTPWGCMKKLTKVEGFLRRTTTSLSLSLLFFNLLMPIITLSPLFFLSLSLPPADLVSILDSSQIQFLVISSFCFFVLVDEPYSSERLEIVVTLFDFLENCNQLLSQSLFGVSVGVSQSTGFIDFLRKKCRDWISSTCDHCEK